LCDPSEIFRAGGADLSPAFLRSAKAAPELRVTSLSARVAKTWLLISSAGTATRFSIETFSRGEEVRSILSAATAAPMFSFLLK